MWNVEIRHAVELSLLAFLRFECQEHTVLDHLEEGEKNNKSLFCYMRNDRSPKGKLILLER